jgi:hypothetical protein
MKSADAAEHTVAMMKDTAYRQLRAYVFMDTTKVRITPAGERQRFYITVRLRNYGQTPAYEMTHIANQFVEDMTTHARSHEQTTNLHKIDAGPRSQIIRASVDFLEPPLVEAIMSGKQLLFVSGEVKYRDAFGIEQTTKYKLMYGGSPSATNRKLRQCEDGNEAT